MQAKKDEHKANENVLAAAFNLEEVLLWPHGPTSSFYYSQHLKIHNFTLTNIDTMETYCFLWHKVNAKKALVRSQLPCRGISQKRLKKVIRINKLFAERCAGQNNNHMVLIALHELIKNIESIKENMNYLVSGHSQNENDTAHSIIENATKT